MEQLAAAERRSEVVSEYATAPGRFASLLEALHSQAGQPVAVLIDEYDKPILDALEVPDIARANRDFLRGLYAVIKDCDAHVRFTFITGVSKFSKVSLFSGLNNLKDITLDRTLFGDLRLHRGRLGRRVRAGVAGLGPGPDPRLVQRLPLARRREGV